MPRYAQLVIGPAGSGKSTYCATMARHAQAIGRHVQVVNLDPAAEHFHYPLAADVRQLISVDDVMEAGGEGSGVGYGPNGGLVFCMEYLGRNLAWLEENLGHAEDDYLLLDCPGQMELYTHLPVMRSLAAELQRWEFRICAVFLVDARFAAADSSSSFRLASAVMAALSAMVSLELPQVNVLTKMDLLEPRARRRVEGLLEPDGRSVMAAGGREGSAGGGGQRLRRLTEVICGLIDDYAMVRFLTLDRRDEEEIDGVLQHVDMMIQYGEDLEVREPREV